MSLENFYTLRNSFLVLGLTGRTASGCNDICDFLTSEENPFATDEFIIPYNIHINEIQKFNICKNILVDPSNKWHKFTVIKYRDILLLFFLEDLYHKTSNNFDNLTYDLLLDYFNNLYDYDAVLTRRLGQKEESDRVIKNTFIYIKTNKSLIERIEGIFEALKGSITLDKLTSEEAFDHIKYLNKLFFEDFTVFAKLFFQLIDKYDPIARQLFLQDIAYNLRSSGKVFHVKNVSDKETEYIFTVTVAIKNIININRKATGTSRILIDSLKNSLEINFFRERYSGFYLIASSRNEAQTNKYLTLKVHEMGFSEKCGQKIIAGIKSIDEAHYRITDFKKGEFTTPDIENCIQKADYYIYVEEKPLSEPVQYNSLDFRYLGLEIQLLKFLALIYKPGIVTPSAIERSMQLAFSSKYNSGCISRQVGAVVTDSNYSVKSIGWNEVPQGQTPCSLRNLKELITGDRPNVYSDYEKTGGDYDGKSFKVKVNETLLDVYGEEEKFFNNLNGHNCPYCFKDFHNSFEGKDNQVHTRSLHAEENAMLPAVFSH